MRHHFKCWIASRSSWSNGHNLAGFAFASQERPESYLTRDATPSTDVNVIKLADFKLDITWDCSDVADINSNGQKAGSGKAAVLFFNVPVTIRDGKVDTDNRPLDLTQYHLANAAQLPH